MQRVIVIDENPDGTRKVTLHNMEKVGQITVINRARTHFACEHAYKSVALQQARFALTIECLPDEENALFTHYDPERDIRQWSDVELFEELRKRKCLVEETIYKIKG